MPKRRPPHLVRERTRHGKIIWYVRIGHGPRFRIEGTYGTQEFVDNYTVAIKQAQSGSSKNTKRTTLTEGSFDWLLHQYLQSMQWHNQSESTKKVKYRILNNVSKHIGDRAYKSIKKQHILDAVDRRRETPAAAKHFLTALNGLFNWAVDNALLNINPALSVKAPKAFNTEGLAPWLEDDIEKYYHRWKLGTHERVWIDVLLYTGLRRGDAVRIGWKDVKENIIHLKTEKSQFKTDVFLPILPELAETLKIGPIGNETFICRKSGNKLVKESFGNLFREACNAAGIKKSAHGLRKLAATRAANAGATVSQMKALFGWTEDKMASLYTKTADRKRLAIEAIKKLQKGSG
ncbi:tyrosine-type recombinase/integrase [Bartonella machadoae]|uniref:tyrosine-type recombinase/integrase n=1 Tax=Bartonella machadoae TaxID=2893471 RepID=UPI001F4D1603|nr:tyrosine-type recombinase/integrase [Bartonella machadoae]UNE55295.1 tyrosine-type recombinase/integrase [Bartonella machadoae]